MRSAVFGAACGAVVVWLLGGAAASFPSARAERDGGTAGHVPPADGLIALTAEVSEGRQQLTVIDPRSRVIGVYHVQLSNGEISLKSVRNIHWDLQMTDFNGVRPLPQEIRSMSGLDRNY